MMRPRVVLAAAGAVALVAGLGACSKNTGTGDDNGGKAKVIQGSIDTNPADSKGPAPAVPGATRGGTIYHLQESDFNHLDPQASYVNNIQAIGLLFSRQLTQFVKDPKTGNIKLLGDLATDTGKDMSNGKCTKWQYTLKDGLKYEDGTPITSKDVGYGIARSFAAFESDGPKYLQQWLSGNPSDPTANYKGPYDGGALLPPGLTTPDDKTIVFDFKSTPHCDLPYAASMPTTTPLPQAKDTKQQYDFKPFSEGPYKVESYTKDTKLVLVRNPYWDAKTDPIRHDYPDKFEVDTGPDRQQQTQRALSSQGNDQWATMQKEVAAEQVPQVANGSADVKARTTNGLTQFTWTLAINNQRITDLKERQALNYAFDKKREIQFLGGDKLGQIANTLESPTTAGWKDYNAYPYNPQKAKQLLGGKHPNLVIAIGNTANKQKEATVWKTMFEAVGFKVQIHPVDDAQYYTIIGKKDNPYDLYLAGWGADWPSGSTIFPPVYSKDSIQPTGNNNYSYFANEDINKKINSIANQKPDVAAPKWADLDKEIMTKYAPVIPLYYDKVYRVAGSKVGNQQVGELGWIDFTQMYAKK